MNGLGLDWSYLCVDCSYLWVDCALIAVRVVSYFGFVLCLMSGSPYQGNQATVNPRPNQGKS